MLAGGAPARPDSPPLSSTRHLQNTARLALLAMFLLLAAPLFSQAVGASAVPAWMSEMACGDGGHEPLGHDAPLWAQCGYCTLLLSSPALPGAPAMAASNALPAVGAGLPGAPHASRGRLAAHDAPPRAPPLRFV